MPTAPAPRSRKPQGQPDATNTEEREPRGARRKRETRLRLLEAALVLMAEKGMEGVAINEITETADVGFGSFYNHFESKEAIYKALMDWVFEDFADALDQLVKDIVDPAEVISVCVRHTLLRAQENVVWGQFLVREGFSARVLERGLGQRLLRDIESGIASKRFNGDDPLMSFFAAGGIVLASISAWLQFGPPQGSRATSPVILKFGVDGLPERTAKTVLCTLGLSRAESDRIAYLPLPPVQSSL
jgi:AcrR family transcriptional regulator